MLILIAEDDPVSRTVLEGMLTTLGYRTLGAGDGEEAWNAFQRERPPIVITDWMMPKLDGLELCRRIRDLPDNGRYTYLIGLTTLEGKRHHLEAIDAGADDFISKPCDSDDLVMRLRVAERLLRSEKALGSLQALHSECAEPVATQGYGSSAFAAGDESATRLNEGGRGASAGR